MPFIYLFIYLLAYTEFSSIPGFSVLDLNMFQIILNIYLFYFVHLCIYSILYTHKEYNII